MSTSTSVAATQQEVNVAVHDDVLRDGPPLGRIPSSRPVPRPASVKINVQGAFIVQDETNSGNRNGVKNGNGNGHANEETPHADYVHFEHKDIRLPHHVDVVSHIAVDVSGVTLVLDPG